MNVECFFDKASSTCQYIVSCKTTKHCAIIDPVLDYQLATGRTATSQVDLLAKFVEKEKLTPTHLLSTHVHADHLDGARELQRRYPESKRGIGSKIKVVQEKFAPVYDMQIEKDGSQFDLLFTDNETFSLGDVQCTVIETPGHTPACVSYIFKTADSSEQAVFVGDTFFMPDGGSGRCDFPHGSAEQMWQSLQRILTLDDETKVYVCHDYQPGGRELKYVATVAEQKKNIHVVDKDAKTYAEWRSARDATLSFPKLLIPSIQVNIRGGKLPEPKEGEKHAHIKIPLNVL